jgi:hypothetical protein
MLSVALLAVYKIDIELEILYTYIALYEHAA